MLFELNQDGGQPQDGQGAAERESNVCGVMESMPRREIEGKDQLSFPE